MTFVEKLKQKKNKKRIAICIGGLANEFTTPWWNRFVGIENITLFGCSADDFVENQNMDVFVSKKETDYLNSMKNIYKRKKMNWQPVKDVSCDEITAARAFSIYNSLFEKKKWELQHDMIFDLVIFASPSFEIKQIPEHRLEIDSIYSEVTEVIDLCTATMNSSYFYGTSNAMNHSSMFFKYLSVMDHDSIYAPFIDKNLIKDHNVSLPMDLLMFIHHMMCRIKVIDAV